MQIVDSGGGLRQSVALRKALLLLTLAGALALPARADNFPQPQFDGGHQLPATTAPAPRRVAWEYVDLAALAAALSLASYLALARRSRNEIFLLTIASVLYFGFWRRGCICPVGSIQNVTLAFFDRTYAVPVTVLLTFALPLAFTLLFGRTFCAAVCPLGAVQDLVVWRPVRLPHWLAHLLSFLPAVYLAAAVLFAAAGGMFVVCRYDPFVGFFRLNGPAYMLLAGCALLALGTFVARPYCRFLCPYAVLLKAASWLSRRHLTITPDVCVNCRLCQRSCPFDAIRIPSAKPAKLSEAGEVRRFARLIVVLPLAVGLGAWSGWRLAPALAAANPRIELARDLAAQAGGAPVKLPLESESFRESGGVAAELYADVVRMERRFAVGSAVGGGCLGALMALKLLGLSLRRRVTEHLPDRGDCFSCGRCFAYCPVHVRREKERREGLPRMDLKPTE